MAGNTDMRVLKLAIIVWMVALGSAVADTQLEIDHLLGFVEKSPCTYERNDTFYSGPEARDHINMKYTYYRGKVKTAEDFINYSATRSKMSGKRYTIHCPGTGVIYASDWLLTELKTFRIESKK
jgi:hypothetical protein